MSAPRITNKMMTLVLTWYLTESVKNLTEFDASDRFVIITYRRDLS